MWVMVAGENPQTKERIDQWNCSLAWLPMLLVNVANVGRSGAAATESFRNNVERRAREAERRAEAERPERIPVYPAPPPLIEGGDHG